MLKPSQQMNILRLKLILSNFIAGKTKSHETKKIKWSLSKAKRKQLIISKQPNNNFEQQDEQMIQNFSQTLEDRSTQILPQQNHWKEQMNHQLIILLKYILTTELCQ